MKKIDSSKTKEALAVQKEIDAYAQRKSQLLDIETADIVEKIKNELSKDIVLKKDEIIKAIEDRTIQTNLEISEKNQRRKKIVTDFIDSVSSFLRKKELTFWKAKKKKTKS